MVFKNLRQRISPTTRRTATEFMTTEYELDARHAV
jgi:hypothetical protein